MTESPQQTELPPAPQEDPSLLGLLNTADHKRIGRMFMVGGVVALVATIVLEVLVRLDLTSSDGYVVLDESSWSQAFALTRDSFVFLFLVPFFLGAAINIVPAQIGAGRLAFPRAAAASFWTWFFGAVALVGAYLANGGPYGGTRLASEGVDLYLISLGTVVTALLLGAITVATTIFSMRAPGLHMDQMPSFSWASLVTSIGLLLTMPILLANLALLYVDHRYSTRFDFDFLGGNAGIWEHIEWAYRTPQLFLFIVPILGVIGEILPVTAGRRVFAGSLVTAAVGAVALFGMGAWAQLGGVEGAKVTDGWQGIVYLAAILGAGLGIVVALGLNIATVLISKRIPKTGNALAAMAAAKLLLLGALVAEVGAVLDWLESVDAFDMDPTVALRFTTWSTAQFQLLVIGAGAAGALAAHSWWAPLICGRKTNAGLVSLSAIAIMAGAIVAAIGSALAGIVSGQVSHPATSSIVADFADDANSGFNTIAAAGTIIVAAGVMLMLLNVVVSIFLKKGAEAGDDPWGGFTPEWEVTTELPDLASGTPLLDALEAQEAGV